MDAEQTQIRKQRGMEIAKTTRIERTEQGWKVPSQSGHGSYLVQSNGFGATCTCPDHEQRHGKCKHIFAVEFIVTQEVDKEGNVTITQTCRKTYAQDWKSYNMAQQVEKKRFMELLGDLTNRIRNPTYTFGRPTIPLSDMAYSMVFKVYSTFSGRRFNTDMEASQEQGFIAQKPHYNSVFNYFAKKELTPLLSQMVALTSLPLKSVEHTFAVDSSGFGTSNFQRWFSFKHGKELSSRKWVKCHLMTGVKSNIVTSVKVTSEFDNDSPELKELVAKTAENFEMEEVCADKAYLSRDNLNTIEEQGATPYVPFKSNSTPKPKGSFIWKKMYHLFQLNNEEFMAHYHQRSNVETTFHMIKAKFGDSVRSKSWTAQVNEVLCKVIAHNICVVIQEMYELGISSNFSLSSTIPAHTP